MLRHSPNHGTQRLPNDNDDYDDDDDIYMSNDLSQIKSLTSLTSHCYPNRWNAS